MPHRLLPLTEWTTAGTWPMIVCPECNGGTLAIVGEVTTIPASWNEYDFVVNRDGDPEDLSGTFVATLRCTNPKCTKQHAVSGEYFVERDYSDMERGSFWVDNLRIKYLDPPVRIVNIPEATPQAVSDAIAGANTLFLINPNAAANQLRQAVEELLTHVGVAAITAKGARLSAHERIVEYRLINREVADALEAVKWIGNSGSHSNNLTVENVLDGADVLNFALRKLFEDQDVLARAAAINANKGIPTPAGP